MKRFLILVLSGLLMSAYFQGFAQKLESGGFELKIKEYAEGETAVVCGPKKPAYGCIVQVKAKDKLKGTYYLSLQYMSETKNILTVKDKDLSLMSPMLVYNKENNRFQYTKNNVLMDEAVIDTTKSMAEQLLGGMLLWLQVKNKLKAEQ